MFRTLIRELGMCLIANSLIFTPIIASAEEVDTTFAVIGFPTGALITGCVLVSMSRKKKKATRAEKYMQGRLKLNNQQDIYIRTETTKTKINKN